MVIRSLRHRIPLLALCMAFLGQSAPGDTVIVMPPPPRTAESPSIVVTMVSQAIESTSTMETGNLALHRYANARQVAHSVYHVEPRLGGYGRYSPGWRDDYPRFYSGPVLWGTWWPWGWGWGGCVNWSVGPPASGGCSGMVFAVM